MLGTFIMSPNANDELRQYIKLHKIIQRLNRSGDDVLKCLCT